MKKILVDNLLEFLPGFIFKENIESNLNSNMFSETCELDSSLRQLF